MRIAVSDLVALLDAALSADYTRVRQSANRIAAAVTPQDPEAAKQIRQMVRRRGVPLRTSGYSEQLPVDSKSRLPLLEEQTWPTSPIFLDEIAKGVFDSFLADAQNADLLSERGLSAHLALLLSGPPGTGKSLLAGHIAAQLGRPLYVVRLDSVISSLLGDTAKNIRNIFDFAPSRESILFLDELDSVAKLRDDKNELGELKRVVNTVIQGLDSLDDKAIVIAATNHPALLDPAIWRRFPYKLALEAPNEEVRSSLWHHFLFSDSAEPSEFASASLLARVSGSLSGSEIESIALSARRAAVLNGTELDIGAVTWAALSSAAGIPCMPSRSTLATEKKKQLARKLSQQFDLNQADVARLIGVTRQAVGLYLKANDDGEAVE